VLRGRWVLPACLAERVPGGRGVSGGPDPVAQPELFVDQEPAPRHGHAQSLHQGWRGHADGPQDGPRRQSRAVGEEDAVLGDL
jgi:hypothetical protein